MVTTRVQPQEIRPVVPEVNPQNVQALLGELSQKRALREALLVGLKHQYAVAAMDKSPSAINPTAAILLFRAGLYTYVGTDDVDDFYRLTELGQPVARAIDAP